MKPTFLSFSMIYETIKMHPKTHISHTRRQLLFFEAPYFICHYCIESTLLYFFYHFFPRYRCYQFISFILYCFATKCVEVFVKSLFKGSVIFVFPHPWFIIYLHIKTTLASALPQWINCRLEKFYHLRAFTCMTQLACLQIQLTYMQIQHACSQIQLPCLPIKLSCLSLQLTFLTILYC